jgi:hypothetical protein
MGWESWGITIKHERSFCGDRSVLTLDYSYLW